MRKCKGITGLTESVSAGRKETIEALKTDLLTLFVMLKCWYVGAVMTFTTQWGEAWNMLIETLTKTDLWTLRQILTEHLVLIITLLTRWKSHLFTTQ